jgi:hypothetical protein
MPTTAECILGVQILNHIPHDQIITHFVLSCPSLCLVSSIDRCNNVMYMRGVPEDTEIEDAE